MKFIFVFWFYLAFLFSFHWKPIEINLQSNFQAIFLRMCKFIIIKTSFLADFTLIWSKMKLFGGVEGWETLNKSKDSLLRPSSIICLLSSISFYLNGQPKQKKRSYAIVFGVVRGRRQMLCHRPWKGHKPLANRNAGVCASCSPNVRGGQSWSQLTKCDYTERSGTQSQWLWWCELNSKLMQFTQYWWEFY